MRDDRHALAEERSLEMHRLIAARLREDPALVASARARVERWRAHSAIGPRWAEEWLRLLDGPLPDLVDAMTDPGERSRRLRQTSPFAGALDARTRWAVWSSVGRRFSGSR